MESLVHYTLMESVVFSPSLILSLFLLYPSLLHKKIHILLPLYLYQELACCLLSKIYGFLANHKFLPSHRFLELFPHIPPPNTTELQNQGSYVHYLSKREGFHILGISENLISPSRYSTDTAKQSLHLKQLFPCFLRFS